MINLIVGENSSGKTLALEDLYSEHETISISSTMEDSYLASVPLSKDKLDAVSAIFDVSFIVDYNMIAAIICNDDEHVEWTSSFKKQLSLICKDISIVYLDEPEYGLTKNEIINFAFLLKELADIFDFEIWMTTHCMQFGFITGAKFYKVDTSGHLQEGDTNDHKDLLLI